MYRMFDSFFNEFFNNDSFFNDDFFSRGRLLSSKEQDLDERKEKSTNYQKSEHEEVSKDGKTKKVYTTETWTDENGVSNKVSVVKVLPNISDEDLKKEKTTKELKAKIKEAVSKEDYETASKLKKELDSL
jgi:hypothetical protein